MPPAGSGRRRSTAASWDGRGRPHRSRVRGVGVQP
jgi:hypothetical protein